MVAAMEIEVLTVADCPHRDVALGRVRDALRAAGHLDLRVTERQIDSFDAAVAAGMRGSPTILIDGRDPFGPEGSEPSLSCRLHRSTDGNDGAPTVAALVEVLG
jgi:hypothetical protein